MIKNNIKQIKIIIMHLKSFIVIFFSFSTGFHLFASQKVLNPLGIQNESFDQRENLILIAHGENDDPEKKEPLTVLDDSPEWWIKEFKTNLKKINSDNFIFLLEKKICPGLRRLGGKKASFTLEDRKKLLAEIVIIYGKILGFSKDNNYFFCLYHYSDFPEDPDIFSVALETLNYPRYRDIIEILYLCHKQELEGNGGGAYQGIFSRGSQRFSESFDDLIVPLIENDSYHPFSSFLDLRGSFSNEAYYFNVSATTQVQEPVESELIDYFSKLIFENTSCRCPGNNRCTRGCVKGGVLPQLRCRGRKNRTRPISYCMGYVNGAIMGTVHSFFDRYCPNQPFNYASCLDTRGGEGNLCEQGFVFPSALCSLGLDGEDRFHLIRNRSIRRNCKNWFRHNGRLIFVRVSEEQGKQREVPLFQEIDMPENPEDLPDGAIIIAASDSIHGHVEIKTGRRECGKGGKDICFCSDFCDSRKGGYKWPFRPKVVFQWHPEFVRLFGSSEKLDFIFIPFSTSL